MSDSEDDYAPIEATTWGSQTPVQSDNNNEAKGWDSLIDPNVKAGPNGLGSGGLHRRGTNFKPISEDLILAQRLNKPVGKKKMQEAIRETELNLGLPVGKEKPARNNNKKKPSLPENGARKFSHKSPSSSTTTSNHQYNVPSTTRVPTASRSNDGGGSNWLQSSLVETPFWENKKETPPVASPPFVNNNNTNTNNTVKSNGVATNGRGNMIPTRPKVDSVWTKGVSEWPAKGSAGDTWGAISNDTTSFSNSGWGAEVDTTDKSPNAGWGAETTTDKTANNSGWGEAEEDKPTTKADPGWGAEVDKPTTNTNSGWGTEVDNTSNTGWGSEPVKESFTNSGWGKEPAKATNEANGQRGSFAGPEQQQNDYSYTNNTHNNAIPSSRPSWLDSIPTYDRNNTKSRQQSRSPPPQSHMSRFSNPSKQRYSENAPMDVPKPVNYRPDQSTPVPLATAPPPPPDNSLLITINVELSENQKISVDIRELDDPAELAREFGRNNNIQAENVIMALTKLFYTQKNTALKKKQQKLQRRVFSNQAKQRFYGNNNVYTKSSSYSQQVASPSPPPPFARKVYY